MKKSLFIIPFLLFTSSSIACTCIGKTKMKKAINHVEVLFTGKIISREIYTDSIFPYMILRKAVYNVLVTERLKGEIKTDTIKIYTGLGNGDCGVAFEIGKNYIIYSNYENELFDKKVPTFLSTNICSRTSKFEDNEFKKIKRYAGRKGYC
ncbi:hypothetical protein [Flavobacterium sp. 25HG05S-40]|uniref:hypothetical protein n=1 Tax=Flavobacterium sp. 25HG05S-40 TaxID=3458682 RepID=UPI00404405FB